MTLAEFNKLDAQKQAELVWEKGILEHHANDGEHHFVLYKIYDFFVEIEFHSLTNDIVKILCFA